MVDAVKSWLSRCPHVGKLSAGTLKPGEGTGLFLKGISQVRRDILGEAKVSQTFILRHRDYPDAPWVELMCAWVLNNQPQRFKVTPQGGKLVSPTKAGWGTWEIELIVESRGDY